MIRDIFGAYFEQFSLLFPDVKGVAQTALLIHFISCVELFLVF